MHSFVMVLSNANGRIFDVRIVDAPDNVMSAVFVPTVFTPADAANYRRQLLADQGINLAQQPSSVRLRVKCWQTGEVFKSAAAAARAIGVSASAVKQHLHDPEARSNVRGYTFSYADEVAASGNAASRVKCDQTGLTYDNVPVAAQVFGVTVAAMRKALNAHTPITINGTPYTLQYVE